MGEIIMRKLKGMNWKSGISLLPALTLVFTICIYQLHGPKGFEAGAAPITACTDCHNMPLDNPTRDSESGRFPGSHNTHGNAPYGYDCSVCHVKPAAGQWGHRDGSINMINPLNSDVGSYSKGVGFPQTNTPEPFGSCSNTYCHGNYSGGLNAQPVWAGTAACGSCHNYTNAPPPSRANHPRHAGTGTGQLGLACVKCHQARSAKDGHVNASVQWSLATGDSRFGSGAIYRGFASGETGAKASAIAYGSCSNLYCHSTGQSTTGGATPTYATPTWGGAALGCAGCHADMAGASGTGSHITHANSYNMACANCHTGYTAGSTNSEVHVNVNIDVAISATYGGTYSGGTTPGDHAPGGGFGSCSTNYCHSTGEAVPTYATPAWGTASSGACGTCHGATKASPPVTFAHEIHAKEDLIYQFRCFKCHSDTVTDADPAAISATGLSAYHVNKTRDVKFDISDPLIGAGAAYDSGSVSCSTIYCHSTGKAGIVPVGQLSALYGDPKSHYTSPQWDGSAGCAFCHGKSQTGGALEGYPDYTMADRELDKGTARANSHLDTTHNATNCSVCHWSTTQDGISIHSNTHVNKEINVDFNPAYIMGGAAAYNPDRSCSNVSCHGVQSGVWGALGTCIDCHEAGAVNISGVHSKHWDTAAGNATTHASGNSSTAAYYQFQCDTCHSGATHPDGVIGQHFADVGFNIIWAPADYKTNGVYNANLNENDTTDSRLQKISTDGSCSSIYCHSSGIAPGAGGPAYADIAWNAAPQTPNCGVCHAAAPVTLSHSGHTVTYSYSCAECHQATVSSSTTIADKSKHVNAVNDVAWKTGGFNIDGLAYDSVNFACSNIYCHSQGKSNAAPYNAAGNAPNTAAVWTTTGLGADCSGCHGGDATAATRMITYRHEAHINNAGVLGSNITCDACHSATVAAGQNRTISSTANHVNKSINVAFTALNAGGSYDGDSVPGGVTVGNCTSLYCHSNGKIGTAAGAYANRAWNGAGIDCNGCHGTGNSAGYPDYSSGGAATDTANSHAKHAATALYNCSACHYSVTTNGAAINGASPLLHIDGNIQDVSFAYGGSYTGGTKTCTTYCHSNVQAPGGASGPTAYASPVWGNNNSMTCYSCHVDMSETVDLTLGTHQRHTNVTDIAEYECSMCHGAGYTSTTAVYPAHANRVVDVSFTGRAGGTYYSGSSAPGEGGYGTCSTNACHGRATRNWGTYTLLDTCEKCHGTAASTLAEDGFRDTSGSKGSVYAGTHKSHLLGVHNYTDPTTCDACHINPSGLGDKVTGDGHWGSLPATLTWDDLATGNIRTPGTPSHSPAYSGASGTPARQCSSTYCHSQGGAKQSPTWGDLGYGLSCGNCHGNPPGYPHPTGAEGANCIGCHYHVASSNTAFKESYLLIEGICSKRFYTDQTSCETNGGTWTPPGVTVPGKTLHIDGINQVTKDECLGCHSNVGDFALLGQHEIHTDNDYFLSRSVTGAGGAATGGDITTVVDTTKTWTANAYANKYVRITSGPNKNQQLMIESNTGNTITVKSGSSFTNAVTDGTNYDIRSAKLLSNDDYDDPGWIYEIYYSDGFPKYACGFCHPDNSSIHRNGIVDLDMDPTHSLPGTVKTKNKPGGPWFDQIATGEDVRCVAVYCHSNGYISPSTNAYQYKTTANWYAAGPWNGLDKCAQCHGNSPNTGGTEGSPAHAGHVVANHFKDVFSGTVGKLARAGAPGSGAVHGDPATATTFNCNLCHYTTVKVGYNDKETVCVTCHTVSGSGGQKGTMVVDSLSSNHIDGNINVDFKTPFDAKSKAQVRDNITTVGELDTSWTRTGGYKLAASHDVSKSTPVYSAGACLSVACHNGTPMEWRAQGPLPCAACHKGLPQ